MIIGVSGYGFTGSSAVFDLLKEYKENNYLDSKRVCEFSIAYEPDGLFDLERAIKNPAKHLRCDLAISRFQTFLSHIEKLYNRSSNGAFSKISRDYLNTIIGVTYKNRRYYSHGKTRASLLVIKILGKFQMLLENRFKKRFPLLKEDVCYISNNECDFDSVTRNYIMNIIESFGLIRENSNVLLDQPFPPNNPEEVFHLFAGIKKCIVVDRDPRDVYLTVKRLRYTTGRFIPHDSVSDFIQYYRSVRTNLFTTKNILRINFEELLYNYNETVKKIEDFLGISDHYRFQEFFKPNLSIKNTQLKDVFVDDLEDIKIIEKELKEYLFPFEKYENKVTHENIQKMASW